MVIHNYLVLFVFTTMPRGLLAGIFLLLATVAGAQQPAPAHPPEGPPLDAAQVEVNGELLFKVRGVTAYPAAKRATAIAERIEKLADAPSFAPASLAIEEKDDRPYTDQGRRDRRRGCL